MLMDFGESELQRACSDIT